MTDQDQNQNQVAQDFFDDFYSTDAGAGGVIARVCIETGYKVYSAGFKGQDMFKTWFAMRPVKKGQDPTPEQAAIKDAIKTFAIANPDSNGATAEYGYGIMVRSYLDGAVLGNGKQVGWKSDQLDFVQSYTDACKGILVPSLQSTGIAAELVKTGSWTGYVRLAWKNDPYFVAQGEAGKKKVGKDNVLEYAQVLYISERFANEAAAREAIGLTDDAPAASSDPLVPTGYTAESWESVWPVLYEAKQNGQTPAQIAADYSATVPQVVNALNVYVPL